MGYFFTLVFIGILFIRPQDYIQAVQGWPLQDVAAILCLTSIFLDGSVTMDKLRRSPSNWLVVAFWVWISLTWLFNGWAGGISHTFIRFSSVAITYFLVVLTVDSYRRLRGLAWTLVAMALFLAIQAIMQYHTGASLGGVEALQASSLGGETDTVARVRGVGLYADPNDMAINMVPFVALLLPAFHRNFMSRSWVPGILCLIPLTLGIVFTVSRGAMLGLLVVGWLYMYRRAGKVISMVGAGVLLLAILAAPRMHAINTQEDSARARLDHWAYGLSLLRENPVTGVGKGNFTADYEKTAHNSFVLIIAEGGMIGGILWVALFISAFRDIRLTRKEPRAPPWLDPALNAAEGALIGWLVCSAFLSQTYKFTSFILMGFVVAILNALKSEGYDVRHPWTMRTTWLTLAVTVGAVIFMHLAVKILWHL